MACDMSGQYRTTNSGVNWLLTPFTRIQSGRTAQKVQYTEDPLVMYNVDFAFDLRKPLGPQVTRATSYLKRIQHEQGRVAGDRQNRLAVVGDAAMALGRVALRDSDGQDGSTAERRWALDLVNQLATLQEPDGSFRPMKDGARWMEDNKVLITAYSLIALEAAQQDIANRK